MAAFLRFYLGDRLAETELTDKTSLRFPSDEFPPCGLKRGALRFQEKNGVWEYASQEPLRGADRAGALEPGRIYALENARIAFQYYCAELSDTQTVELGGLTKLTLGRSQACTIAIPGREVSSRHASLSKAGGVWMLEDLGSVNGTYLNGAAVQKAEVKPGDAVDVGLCRLVFGNVLTVRFPGGGLRLPAARPAERRPYDEEKGYPFAFRRSPRLLETAESGAVSIDPPPPAGAKQTGGLAGILIPSLSTVGVMAVMTVALGLSPISLAFSVPTALVGAAVTVHNVRAQRRRGGEKERLRVEKYEAYLAETEQELSRRADRQRQVLCAVHPETRDCLPIAAELQRRLWERRPQDEDFLTLRLGSGSLPASFEARTAREHLTLEEDPLAPRAAELAARYEAVPGCPIVLGLREAVTAGIVGDREQALRLARNLAVQAAVHHSADELRIVTLCRPEEWPRWQFVKWLPHAFASGRSRRLIADSPEAARRLLVPLEEELAARERRGSEKEPLPYYLFLCAAPEYLRARRLLSLLTKNDPSLGACAVFLSDRLENLPKECSLIVDVKAGRGRCLRRDAADQAQEFTVDAMDEESFDAFARALAPVRLEEDGQRELPRAVTFLQGYGVRRPEEFDVASNWKSGRPDKSMAVPIGVRAGNEPFVFDIHQSRHGPHGLVAGMTGSGKSEMAQSWILSMALRFSPQQVSFVLIDFKGTGLLLPFRRLPHLAGSISDLDKNISRNLASLESELTRRKKLLDSHGVSTISDYLRLFRAGKAEEPMPYLFLIVDEFAEFKQQFPEFMPVVDRVFAIGRTLGVHIILLTQKPGSVVDEKMSANTRFRWCLKVASAADSRDMLGTPDAAYLANPGSAYVRIGEGEIYEQIQSYWSGAPYDPLGKRRDAGSESIALVQTDGTRAGLLEDGTVGTRVRRTELETTVAYLDRFAEEHHIPRAAPIWTEKLPERLPLAALLPDGFSGGVWPQGGDLCLPAGLADDPANQRQFPFLLDFAQQGHIAVYGASGSGKTTLLSAAVVSAALSLPPDAVSVYLMDFGGGMGPLEGLPHVGGAAAGEDGAKIRKLASMLADELQRRRKLFASCGAKNLESYRELTGGRLPRVLLVLDNFAPVPSLYPELDPFFAELSRDGAAFGMHWLVSAANPSALPFRVSQNFKWAAALHLPDRLDYGAIVGRTGGLEPEDVPGRGLMKGTPPLEFQAALPVPGDTEPERLRALRALCEAMDAAWKGARPAPIPVMPQEVSLADASGEGIFLGLDTEEFSAVSFDPAGTPFLLLSQAPDAGGEVLLTAILAQYAERAPEKLFCFAPNGLPAPVPGLRLLRGGAELDEALAALMPVLQRRKEAAESGEQEAFPPIVVAVADLAACRAAASEQSRKRFHLIAALGRGLGVYAAVLGSCADVSRLAVQGDPFLTELAENGAAVLLGGSAQQHDGIPLSMRSADRLAELGAHEGYFRGGRGSAPVRFKAVSRL